MAPHEAGNADLIAAVTGDRPLGTLPFLPAPVRDNPDAIADALVARPLASATLRRLLEALLAVRPSRSASSGRSRPAGTALHPPTPS